jgi:hypothetical protein
MTQRSKLMEHQLVSQMPYSLPGLPWLLPLRHVLGDQAAEGKVFLEARHCHLS